MSMTPREELIAYCRHLCRTAGFPENEVSDQRLIHTDNVPRQARDLLAPYRLPSDHLAPSDRPRYTPTTTDQERPAQD